MVNEKGFCHLVGAGPGNPGLLTLLGKECLSKAQVVVYDHLCSAELLHFAPKSAEYIYAGKKAGRKVLSQEAINQLLIEKAKSGLHVVRLKGGDPFLFGRGGEEAEALATAGIAFGIVPGVSSAIAGPAYAGIPVTHRSYGAYLTIFTGHEDLNKSSPKLDYAALTHAGGTKVMLMGMARLGTIIKELLIHGMHRSTPVALIRWATTGCQQTLCGPLEEISQKAKEIGFTAPAVAVFGEVVRLREKLNWFESRPLFGKRIAVTRSTLQASTLLRALSNLGADAFELPTIRIEPPQDERAFLQLVADTHKYDWLIFTSPNGVDTFFQAFFGIYKDVREIGGVRIAAIGPATAERIRSYYLQVDLMPTQYVAEAVVRAFQEKMSVENLRILLARSGNARPFLRKELTRLGAIVDEAIAYRTVPESDECVGMRRFCEEGADIVTFTSSSTVENFVTLQLSPPENFQTASIGPITSRTLTRLGFSVDIEAIQHTIPGLVKAICQYYAAP
ncbi:Uroporphyrinogen-III C-methyltransferase [Candidatus Xiphinematobacter sp. Idaho Grape]|uniref:uroporphyrinogen-III C-methyltransferase n=1 Tax=Candidatus Xiphinematobacter sp. Idaho Grape TaxID=1704307 RepID=UPI0007066435|nr:uroporphyrinogen-III C-methyltransferase [Candidatus Xiphinematobacter sp. Idaho Grape]ALJ57007.1 Uroporphyrinogen-III C-methyltransferase [Candidatus Xiphinematobacter sp. Idaho Grape]